MAKPTLTPVESSNLAAVGYELLGGVLYVEFKTGKTYRYFNVPLAVYNALLAAESVGKFLNAEVIRGPYGYEQIDPEDPAENLFDAQRQLDADGVEVGVSRQALDEVLAELRYLRYFRDAAGDAFGPADSDVYWGINEDYEKRYGPVPKPYANEVDE